MTDASPGHRLTLQNDLVSLSMDARIGGRIVSLIDKRSGRDWMAAGAVVVREADTASFGLAEAAGWDECFPTVSPCDAQATAWGRALRDHGDLWGRPWQVETSRGGISACYQGDQVRFARRLSLAGNTIMATYNVTNTSDVTLPYMWSQHALLAVAPGDDIVLPGVERVSVTHLKSEGATRAATTIAWPDHELNLAPRRLDAVVGPDARFAGKFYARVDRPFCASIGNATGRLELSWDAEILPYVGIWLNYGAWPINEQSSHHIAIEPTTAPVDSLAEAIAAGSQVQLPARGSHSWSTTLRLLGAAC